MSAEAIPTSARASVIHPLWVRVTHWINAVATLVMIGSGWEIYNASPLPLFRFELPKSITLGGWLAGALAWHFAAMWVLTVNGLVYVTLGLTGRFRTRLFPIRPREVVRDFVAALRRELSYDDLSVYNSVQKLFYLIVICAESYRSVGTVDLEADPIPGADHAVRRLRPCPLRPLLRHEHDRAVSRRAHCARAARAEEPAGDDHRPLGRLRCPASARSFPASIPGC